MIPEIIQDEQKDGKPILLPLSQIPLPWAKIPRPEMSSNSQIFQSVQEMRCWLCGRWNYLLQAEPPTVGRTTAGTASVYGNIYAQDDI